MGGRIITGWAALGNARKRAWARALPGRPDASRLPDPSGLSDVADEISAEAGG